MQNTDNGSLRDLAHDASMPDGTGNTAAASYSDITRLIERLHRRYLDVIRYELSQMGIDDINAVQALLLMNVQNSEVSIRELVDRGYYIGSNVTYNVRHLFETDYLEQERSERDRRSVRIRSTKKGNDLCKSLAEMEARHADALGPEVDRVDAAWALLRGLERVWSDDIRFG
jgi:DNA-binding MarR family transcriptional regulator